MPSFNQQKPKTVNIAALNARSRGSSVPLPGASELETDGWGAGSSAAGGQHGGAAARAPLYSGDDEGFGADPLSPVSGDLQGLHGRGDGEFETIDWTFYQERDRQ